MRWRDCYEQGFMVVRGWQDMPAARWLADADAAYARVLRGAPAESLPLGVRYVPTASSLSLSAMQWAGEVLAALPSVVRGFVCEMLEADRVACDVDEAWLRRQYAPARYPPHHAPHGWHQDGALRYDFLRTPDPPADALLKMVTCWLPLVPCGQTAPGLELVGTRCERLFTLGELAKADQLAPRRTPRMQPGDVLLILGGTLHRTYVQPEMTDDRTSIELRFFDADHIPPRVAGDQFVVWEEHTSGT